MGKIKRGLVTLIATGTLAVSVAVGTFLAKYREYLGDPDLIPKVYYDISQISKEKSQPDLLYTLLINNDSRFKSELEKRAKTLSKNLPEQLNNERLTIEFKDKEHFISYLQGPHQFLNKSLELGFFIDAAETAKRLELQQENIEALLNLSELQGNQMGYSKLKKEDYPNISHWIPKDWFLRFFHETYSIKQYESKRILKSYGDTKRHIIRRFRQEYRNLDPASLTSYEKKIYEEI